jgi:hypothetical protein
MKTPLHLWIVGVVSLIWNGWGGAQYILTQTRNEAFLGALPPATREFLIELPTWYVTFWAIGVWGSVIGSILLLLRSRHAAMAFLVSVISFILTALYAWGIAQPQDLGVNGNSDILFAGLVMGFLIGLWIYSNRMVTGGVLR